MVLDPGPLESNCAFSIFPDSELFELSNGSPTSPVNLLNNSDPVDIDALVLGLFIRPLVLEAVESLLYKGLFEYV
ncbi:unnamed protein product [[Candida] boidinii]|nr:unnamed protein product [[Candida] boidinii]